LALEIPEIHQEETGLVSTELQLSLNIAPEGFFFSVKDVSINIYRKSINIY